MDRLLKANRGINRAGAVVVLLDFERQLAATELAGRGFDRIHHAAANALAAVLIENDKVMDVQQRPRGECREPAKANRHPDWRRALECEHDSHQSISIFLPINWQPG